MQHHTVQQIEHGPQSGKWIYTGGNHRIGRYAECCSEAWLEMLQTPAEERDTSPAWERIGHDTADEAYAHMREVLIGKLRLGQSQYTDWSGCRALRPDGSICDTPTKNCADIPPMHFNAPLCDEHLNTATVEAMWNGPGDWSGSW